MKYSSRDYEQFTQALHQRIIEEEGYSNVDVLHNQNFIGKSKAKHQIDVCWTLEIGRIQQLFCVECKYWKNKVKKDHIASFITKLEDIGNARGIFVTTNGFQLGATRLAKHSGITLINATYTIENREATMSFCAPRFHDFRTTFEDVSSEILEELGRLERSSASAADVKIFDSTGEHIGSLTDLTEQFSHENDGHYQQAIEDRFIYVLGNPIQIKYVEYTYEQNILGTPLNGNYEIANAKAHYIFDDREISAILNSHRSPSFD